MSDEKKKEPEYRFVRMVPKEAGEPGEMVEEEMWVKQSKLTPQQQTILAKELWEYFIGLPVMVQTVFLTRVDAQIAMSKEAHTPRNKAPLIIMPGQKGEA